jgi:hypothetical protein
VNAQLNPYFRSTQVYLVGQDSWDNYPAWRREAGIGRFRNKIVSDSNIRYEMSIFGATMNFAAKKKYISAADKFAGRPKLKTMRRDEFNLEEYRKLHTVGRAWVGKATKPDDSVFTTSTGEPAKTLYKNMIDDLLTQASLRDGSNGVPRLTYCFRHTYATFRLSEGVDVYFLAEQMGTSVKMIEDHYGHVNTVKHADRVLIGMGGWEPVALDDGEADAKASRAVAAKTRLGDKSPTRPRNQKKR